VIYQQARTTMLASQKFELRPPINGAAKMRNDDRTSNDKTDGERLEDLGGHDERKEAIKDQVPFIETLDAQTRAELDEVLERSIGLAQSVIAALKTSTP
jgi:hypothetical protein